MPDDLGKNLKRKLVRKVEQAHIDRLRDAGIIEGAVGGGQGYPQLLPERAEVVTTSGRHEDSSQLVGIYDLVELEQVRPLQESRVKTDIMPHDRQIADKFRELLEDIR